MTVTLLVSVLLVTWHHVQGKTGTDIQATVEKLQAQLAALSRQVICVQCSHLEYEMKQYFLLW